MREDSLIKVLQQSDVIILEHSCTCLTSLAWTVVYLSHVNKWTVVYLFHVTSLESLGSVVGASLSGVTLQFTPITAKLGVNDTVDVGLDLRYAHHLVEPAVLQFTYQINGGAVTNTEERLLIKPIPDLTLSGNTTHRSVAIVGWNVGQLILGINSTSAEFQRLGDVFVSITVVHSDALVTINAVIGWIYFAAWTISFYPQVILNWYRKSVVGLSFDFTGYNIVGYIAYGLYNVGMYWIPEVKEEYRVSDPHGVNPVQLNDVYFTLHGIVITILIVVQIAIYERGGQKLSRVCIVVMILSGIFATVTLFLSIGHVITWLTYLFYFSYIKLVVTVIKYSPQVYLNYQRKSTVGFSITGVILDLVGGIFSLLQMLLIAYNSDDWVSLYGDPTKFGLGLVTIVFDLIFCVQHYILYKNSLYQRIVESEINS
ncbi:hypothetical protein ScPMuIL_009790 [Solemya velum]